jgi:hypothetical protein
MVVAPYTICMSFMYTEVWKGVISGLWYFDHRWVDAQSGVGPYVAVTPWSNYGRAAYHTVSNDSKASMSGKLGEGKIALSFCQLLPW